MLDSSTLTQHIVLGGCGRLGRHIVRELVTRGYGVVVVEKEGSLGKEQCHCPVIIGDICDEAVLREAGIERARCLLAVTGDDRTNLEAAIVARALAPQVRAVVRIFDQSLAMGVEQAFGVQALSASFLALPAYVSAATEETILAAFDIDGRQLNFYRHDRPAAADTVHIRRQGNRLELCGAHSAAEHPYLTATLGDLGHPTVSHQRSRRRAGDVLRACCAAWHPRRWRQALNTAWRQSTTVTQRLLIALLSFIIISVIVFVSVGEMSPLNALYFVTTTLTTVGYGDFNLMHAPAGLKIFGIFMMICGAALLATLYAIIADRVLSARIEHLLGRRAVSLSDHIVVIGLGKVGYRVARTLHTLGFPVVAVEANDDSDHVISARLVMPVVIGNAGRMSVLQKAGISRARTVLALTDDPMLNLSVVLHARQQNPHIRSVVRTFESTLADRLQLFNLDAIISTSAIAAPVFTNAALYPGVEGSFTVDGDDILVVRHPVTADSPFAGMTIAEMSARFGIAVMLVADSPGAPYRLAAPLRAVRQGDVTVFLLTRTHLDDLAGMHILPAEAVAEGV